MDTGLAPSTPRAVLDVRDGLGDRFLVADATGVETLEMLCLRPDFDAVPSFEFALRERVSRLANFRHAYYARVRRVDRLAEPGAGLAIVSEHVPGARLSEILEVASERHIELDINAALCLIRQLVPAVSMLHQNARDVAHGALGPERIVVTPHARLVIVEYVLGSALEQLHYSRERLWKEFRVAVAASAGLPRFDHRADVTQIGLVALSLILGRPVGSDEYPQRIPDLLASASETSALGGREPLSAPLRLWLGRALQLDMRYSFNSALEAQVALDEVLSEESGYIAAPIALETFLARYQECAAETVAARPVQAPRPAAPRSVEPTRRPAESGHDDVSPITAIPPVSEPPAPHAREIAHPAAPARPAPPHPPEPPIEPPRLEPRRPVAATPAPPIAPTPEPPCIFTDREAPRTSWGRRIRRAAIVALFLVAVGEAAFIAWRGSAAPVLPATSGTLTLESRPAAAAVVVDGRSRGVTPITLTLSAGAHVLEIRSGGEPRVIPLTITAGAQLAQYIELQAAAMPATGQLQIRTQPSGARVSIDGQPRGVSPLSLTDLEPGDHEVLLESDLGAVHQAVTIEAGVTASLVVPLTGGSNMPVSGWVAIDTPVEVQLFEGGRLLGTSQTDRIMVSAGRHEIEIVNDTLGYRATRVVQVPPGKVAPVRLDLPRGTVNLNALPWAEVWVDGEKVGDTPLGNLAVPIGPHEIVFRHPQLGEQRHAVTVTLTSPTRLSVDLRK